MAKTPATILYNEDGTVAVSTQDDNGVRRVEIAGKVSVTGAIAPPSTTQVLIHADTPLTVGSHDTAYVIPNGETFHLQEIHQGNEDPTKGASVEIIYYDGTAEHLLERVYSAGTTVTIGYPDVAEARDGTSMVGDGSTKTILVRRAKYSGSDIAIDTEVVGYVV